MSKSTELTGHVLMVEKGTDTVQPAGIVMPLEKVKFFNAFRCMRTGKSRNEQKSAERPKMYTYEQAFRIVAVSL